MRHIYRLPLGPGKSRVRVGSLSELGFCYPAMDKEGSADARFHTSYPAGLVYNHRTFNRPSFRNNMSLTCK
jgi:hypothetical protein